MILVNFFLFVFDKVFVLMGSLFSVFGLHVSVCVCVCVMCCVCQSFCNLCVYLCLSGVCVCVCVCGCLLPFFHLSAFLFKCLCGSETLGL